MKKRRRNGGRKRRKIRGGGESTLQKHMEPMELFLGDNVENEYIKKMKKKEEDF